MNVNKSIEEDDEKMEELLMLQSMVEDIKPMEYLSIEAKYEESLLIDQILGSIEDSRAPLWYNTEDGGRRK